MKTSRYTQAQIIAILRQAEGGVPVAELCREHGMSSASLYKWRAKYGGMDASLISQMKAIEDENWRLKRMYADLSMQAIERESILLMLCAGISVIAPNWNHEKVTSSVLGATFGAAIQFFR